MICSQVETQEMICFAIRTLAKLFSLNLSWRQIEHLSGTLGQDESFSYWFDRLHCVTGGCSLSVGCE